MGTLFRFLFYTKKGIKFVIVDISFRKKTKKFAQNARQKRHCGIMLRREAVLPIFMQDDG
jgi:hypothetical protein